jgi:hypothetical protein
VGEGGGVAGTAGVAVGYVARREGWAAGLQTVARLSRTTGVGAAHDALRRRTPWGNL